MFFANLLKNKNKTAPFIGAKGYLAVPANTETLYGEPAILYKAKVGARLYEKPPAQLKNNYVPQSIDNDFDEDLGRYLVVRQTKDNQEENMVISHVFKKNETVLARPFEYPDPNDATKKIKHPFLLQVMTFERTVKKSQVPGEEDRTDVGDEVTLKELGYMYKEDLSSKEKFKREKQNIFPHPPMQSDVVQGAMGDCFLLASINALFVQDSLNGGSRGRDFILNMMKQCDDGSVIVRLFHPITLQPIYVRVENALHERRFLKGLISEGIYHQAPWVHILEKAYAGLGFIQYTKYRKEQNKKYHAVISSDSDEVAISPGSFLTLFGEGGRPEFAMSILTGEKATYVPVISNALNNSIISRYPFAYSELLSNDLIGEIGIPIDHVMRAHPELDPRQTPTFHPTEHDFEVTYEAIRQEYTKKGALKNSFISPVSWEDFERSQNYQVFAGREDICIEWIAYLNLLNLYFPDEFQKLIKLWEIKKTGDYLHANIEDLWQTVTAMEAIRPKIPESVINRFKYYIYGSEIKDGQEIYRFPGPVTSGIYSENEYQLYDQLNTALTNGHLLTTGTNNDFGKESVAGIVSSHAYTITGVQKKLVNGKILMMVSLRNPWAAFGRTYDFVDDGLGTVKGVGKKINEGEFDIDIIEFAKYFHDFSIGQTPLRELNDNIVNLPQVDITCFPFKTLKNDKRDTFILALLNQDKRQIKGLLANQGIQDLYELNGYLQHKIVEQKNKLSVSPVLAKDLKAQIASERALQRLVRSRFNLRITKNKETFKVIATNSKRYLKQQNKKQNVVVKYFNAFKSKLDMLFTRGKYTNRYIKLYDNHERYQKNVNILTSDYAALGVNEQKAFVDLLMRQSTLIQDLVLQTQTIPALQELKNFIDENNVVWTLFGSEFKGKKQTLPGGGLPLKLKEIVNHPLASIERRYNAKKYGETTDPINSLLHEFLSKNRQILISIMQTSGVPKEHLQQESLKISLLPSFDNNYDLRVQLTNGGMSKPVTLPRDEVLNFAWCALGMGQRNKLREMLVLGEKKSMANDDFLSQKQQSAEG